MRWMPRGRGYVSTGSPPRQRCARSQAPIRRWTRPPSCHILWAGWTAPARAEGKRRLTAPGLGNPRPFRCLRGETSGAPVASAKGKRDLEEVSRMENAPHTVVDAPPRFNPLDYPLCLTEPRYLSDTKAWQMHIPFAFACVEMLRPRVFVELGT